MIKKEIVTTEEITVMNVESFLGYLETESEIAIFDDERYDVVKHYSNGPFQILERTEDFSRARAIADFHILGNNNMQTIIYSPYGEPIYVGKDPKLNSPKPN